MKEGNPEIVGKRDSQIGAAFVSGILARREIVRYPRFFWFSAACMTFIILTIIAFGLNHTLRYENKEVSSAHLNSKALVPIQQK